MSAGDKYREADWRKKPASPVVDHCVMQFRWKRQRAPRSKAVLWRGITPMQGSALLICVTPTLLGEEKPPFQTRRSRVVRRLLSWLIDALVRAGQRRQYLSRI